MGILNRPLFWDLLILGWFVSAVILSLVGRYFVPFEEISRREVWVTGIVIHVLAILCGFSFARTRGRL